MKYQLKKVKTFKKMIFKIGDIVEVIDDSLYGKILAIKQHEITLLTQDGFTIQVNTTEIIKTDDAFSVNIDDIYKSIQEKDASKKVSPKIKKQHDSKMEVDLHIYQLVDVTRGMTNHEMLTLQLKTAKRKLAFAMKNHIQKVVFIHGVGEGVLKMELEYLFKRYENITFYDADFKKYGLGATEVYIYQN